MFCPVAVRRDQKSLDVVEHATRLGFAFGVFDPREEAGLDLLEHDDVLPQGVVGVDQQVHHDESRSPSTGFRRDSAAAPRASVRCR